MPDYHTHLAVPEGARTIITRIGDQGAVQKAKQPKPDLDIELWQELGLLREVP